MASLRDQIATELVARLDALTGWAATLRGGDEVTNVAVLAIVAILGESKRPRDSLMYACTLQLGVLIRGRHEDADPTLDGYNPVRYMDRLVATAERAVHASPWQNEALISITGHTVDASEDPNVFEATLTLTVDYRHNFDDPDQYAPGYVP